MQFTDASVINDMWMEVALSNPITQMDGIAIVVDCKGVRSSILKWLLPKNCQISSMKIDLFPMREWTMHFVNMGPILNTCVALVKPFVSKTNLAKVSEQAITS